MPLSVAYKNALLNNAATQPDALSLHLSAPGSTGTGELNGATGSPFYARKTPTWGSASAGSLPLAATFPVFDCYATAVVAHVGLWKSGVYYGYVTVTTETFASQGTYTITSGSIDLNSTASA